MVKEGEEKVEDEKKRRKKNAHVRSCVCTVTPNILQVRRKIHCQKKEEGVQGRGVRVQMKYQSKILGETWRQRGKVGS